MSKINLRLVFTFFALFILSSFLISCPNGKKSIKVTKIEISENTKELYLSLGEEGIVRISEILPANATDKTIIWSCLDNDNTEGGPYLQITPSSDTMSARVKVLRESDYDFMPLTINARAKNSEDSFFPATDWASVYTQQNPITNIEIDPPFDGYERVVNDGFYLSSTITYKDEDKSPTQHYEWVSEDEEYLTVDQYGYVKPIKVTNTSIGITCRCVENHDISDTVYFTVLPKYVSYISVRDAEGNFVFSPSLKTREKKVLYPIISPADATDKRVQWSIAEGGERYISISQNEDGSCEIQAKDELTSNINSAKVVVTALDGSNVKETIYVSVVSQKVTSVSLDIQSSEMKVGDENTGSIVLTATVLPESATNKELNWTSTDESIATVNPKTGSQVTVTAKSLGTCIIKATAAGDVSAEFTATVVRTPVSSISVSPSTFSLKQNEDEVLTATVLPNTATDKRVSWSSSKSNIVEITPINDVSARIKVVGYTQDPVTINASSISDSSAKSSSTLNILATPVDNVVIDKTDMDNGVITLENGSEFLIKATVYPEYASCKDLIYTSSASSVATINENGKLTCKADSGSATITVKSADDQNKSDSFTLNAIPMSIQNAELNYSSLQLSTNDEKTLSYTITPAQASVKTVQFTSSDPNTVSVDSNGKITCLKSGSATITCTIEDYNSHLFTLTCSVGVDCYITLCFDEWARMQTHNSLKNWDGIIEWSTDLITWNEWNGSEIRTANKQTGRQYIYLRGTGNTTIVGDILNDTITEIKIDSIENDLVIKEGRYWDINIQGSTSTSPKLLTISGDIRNLLNYKDFSQIKNVKDGAFDGLFYNCADHLRRASELVLMPPVSKAMYRNMFAECINLVYIPSLPFTELTEYCYAGMFRNKISSYNESYGIINSPALPATTLKKACYACMFEGCTRLSSAPALPATVLAEGCYYKMFNGCKSITSTPSLIAETTEFACYLSMFEGCSSLCTISTLPALGVADGAYQKMFKNCPLVKISTQKSNEYSHQFNVGYTGTSGSLAGMFEGTSGEFTGTPELAHIYWINGDVIYHAEPESVELLKEPEEIEAYDNTSMRVKVLPLGACQEVTYSSSNETVATIDQDGIICALLQGNTVITASTSNGKKLDYTFSPKAYSGKIKALKFSSQGEFSIKANSGKTWNGSLEYTTDYTQNNWTLWEGEAINSALDSNESVHKLYIRGTGNSVITGMGSSSSDSNRWIINSSTPVECSGDIRYIQQYDNLNSVVCDENCFYAMFKNCDKLSTAPELPYTKPHSHTYYYSTVPEGCYTKMFMNCSSLTASPALPAQRVDGMNVYSIGSYASMFEGCTSLTYMGDIAAKYAESGAMYRMFAGCTSLKNIRGMVEIEGIKTTFDFTQGAFAEMFKDCTALEDASGFVCSDSGHFAFNQMFSGCSALTTPAVCTTKRALPHSFEEMYLNCTSLKQTPVLYFINVNNDACVSMFENCTSLETIRLCDNFKVQYLGQYCYEFMFCNCTSLQQAPQALIADSSVQLQMGCYRSMFEGCSSLTTPVNLPAKNLEYMCYGAMFYSSGIVSAPLIEAEVLDELCYVAMLSDCKNLESIPLLYHENLPAAAYTGMFSGSSKLKFSSQKDDTYKYPIYIGSGPLDSANRTPYDSIFEETTGPYNSNPQPNTIYYSANEVIYTNDFDNLSAVVFESPEQFSIKTANSTKNWNGTLEYSTNAKDWNVWDGTFELQSALYPKNRQNYIAIRGTGNNVITGMFENSQPTKRWIIQGENVSCSGDIRTLLNYQNPENANMSNSGCFKGMFSGNASLISSPSLPSLTLNSDCYYSMFENCINLKSAPELPATNLAQACYMKMFSGCTSLVNPPSVLPCNNINNYSYKMMFANCSSLTIAPSFTAESVGSYSLESMFEGCSSLTGVSDKISLNATTLLKRSYLSMFKGCSKITTVPQGLAPTSLAEGCMAFMFKDCSLLTNSPEVLPALTLAAGSNQVDTYGCYQQMFQNCTSLLTAPKLPAKNVVNQCYFGMFAGCTSLNKIPYLPILRFSTGSIATDACNYMFYECSSIEVSASYTSQFKNLYRIPECDNSASSHAKDMFKGTTGALNTSGTPTSGIEFYVKNEILYPYELDEFSLETLTDTIEFGESLRFKVLPQTLGADPHVSWSVNNQSLAQIDEDGLLKTLGVGEVIVTATNPKGDKTASKTINITQNSGVVKALLFESVNSFTIKANSGKTWNSSLEWATEYPTSNWTEWNGEEISASLNSSSYKLYLRGLNNNYITHTQDENAKWIINGSGVTLSGDMRYLLQYNDLDAKSMYSLAFANLFNGCSSLISVPSFADNDIEAGCYYQMFKGCTGLTSIPDDLLPRTSLTGAGQMEVGCYEGMFKDCTNLTNTPNLPATTLAPNCYKSMFEGCESLLESPSLPSTSLCKSCYAYMFKNCRLLEDIGQLASCSMPNDWYEEGCYQSMFENCTSLIATPVLNPISIGPSCYRYMFKGCTNLKTISTLQKSTDSIKTYSYAYMFENCTSLETVSSSLLPSTSLMTECYEGMFKGCSSLTTLPSLPATKLQYGCYRNMFENCSSLSLLPNSYFSANDLTEGDARCCYSGMFKGCINLELEQGFTLSAPVLVDNCYEEMFAGCTKLTLPSSFRLSSTEIADECYSSMFEGCTSLTLPVGFELPATTVPYFAYYKMFKNCTSIVNPPTLSAMELDSGAYFAMFSGCTSLKEAPSLPALTLAPGCYTAMFVGCENLESIPRLLAPYLANQCYQGMFTGCTKLYFSTSRDADEDYIYSFSMPAKPSSMTDEPNKPFDDMFLQTSGPYTGTPKPGDLIWTKNRLV